MAKAKETAEQKRPKVSVVVPIYNVEKYLRECVDSILGQTLHDIEVILVDDGSPDGSPKIVDEYAAKDKRVVAVHRKNGGYSKAVNYGIEIAKGEYIGIIESDDWIEPDMYEKLYESAKKYDTDVTKAEFYYYQSQVIGPERDKRFTNDSGVDLDNAPEGAFDVSEWPQIVAFHASIWTCLYRSEFVKKIKLIDTKGASYQDFPFMIEVMCKAKRISVVKKPMVHWRNDPKQGNSTSQTGRKLLFMPENTMNAYKIMMENDRYDDIKEGFFTQAMWANYEFFYRIDKQYQREYFDKLVKIFAPIKDDPHFMYRFFRPCDVWLVKQLLNGDWREFKKNDIKRNLKGHLYRLARLWPSYRAIDYIKWTTKQNGESIEFIKKEVRAARCEDGKMQ